MFEFERTVGRREGESKRGSKWEQIKFPVKERKEIEEGWIAGKL